MLFPAWQDWESRRAARAVEAHGRVLGSGGRVGALQPLATRQRRTIRVGSGSEDQKAEPGLARKADEAERKFAEKDAQETRSISPHHRSSHCRSAAHLVRC